MKKIILILLLCIPFWGISQSHTFTESEVIKMDSLFQVYEQNDSIQKIQINILTTQLTNYTNLHELDSLELHFMNEKTTLLNHRIDLYIDLTKELRPKWYNKPIIHFFLGAATITTAAIVLDKIK
tara:strand:+ start:2236 stop:2610 length:375 start_codon:yes stop_codon:yes gene_type:complete